MDMSRIFSGTLGEVQKRIYDQLVLASDRVRASVVANSPDAVQSFINLGNEIWSATDAGQERFSALHALRLAYAAAFDSNGYAIFDAKLKECLLWCKMALSNPITKANTENP